MPDVDKCSHLGCSSDADLCCIWCQEPLCMKHGGYEGDLWQSFCHSNNDPGMCSCHLCVGDNVNEVCRHVGCHEYACGACPDCSMELCQRHMSSDTPSPCREHGGIGTGPRNDPLVDPHPAVVSHSTPEPPSKPSSVINLDPYVKKEGFFGGNQKGVQGESLCW